MVELKTVQNIEVLQKDPSKIIPAKLLNLMDDPSQIKAVPFDILLGRMDEEYSPTLSLLVYKKGGSNCGSDFYIEWDNWDKVLNNHWKRALKTGLMQPQDQALLSLIAQNHHPDGLEIEILTIASALRGKGIGGAFYDHLEDLLKTFGYRYLFGVNHPKSAEFFLHRGRYPAEHLKAESLDKRLPWTLSSIRSVDVATIKFLDRELEEECVKSEFLRIKKS